MHNRRSEFFVVDILVATDKILRGSSGLTFQQFVSDEKEVDSVLRNLEIIGEAMGQLLKADDFLDKTNEEWRKIVNLRNVIIHFYFGVDLDLIFREIIQKDILTLQQSIITLLNKEKKLTCFFQVVEDTKADLAEIYRHESVAYLEKVENLLK